MATRRRRARSSAQRYVTVSCRCAVCDKDIPIARSPLPAATGRSNVIDVVALVGSAQVSPECSLEFMALLPREIALALRRAEGGR